MADARKLVHRIIVKECGLLVICWIPADLSHLWGNQVGTGYLATQADLRAGWLGDRTTPCMCKGPKTCIFRGFLRIIPERTLWTLRLFVRIVSHTRAHLHAKRPEHSGIRSSGIRIPVTIFELF